MSKLKKELDTVIPNYQIVKVSCACGASFESGSTLTEIRVDICSACHPYFTGNNKLRKSQGQVEKFNKKYNIS